jgi:3-methyladenine DNA glycosylase Tag
MSWRVIEAKWAGFEEAFMGFDPRRVARMTAKDVDRLVADGRIIRNRRKIEATMANARTMLALDKEHHGFKRFLRSQRGFARKVAALVQQFKFIGDVSAYFFPWVVSEPVPSYRAWTRSRGGIAKRRRR